MDTRLWRYNLLLNLFCKILLILSCLGFSSAWAQTTGVILNTSVEFQSPTEGFSSTDPWTAVAHYNNSTYYVWIDANFRPWVTQITNGVTTTVPLDPGTDYTVQPDGHHRFSIGVDKTGYLHVTGDMHHYYDGTTGVINPYPLRYQKQTILYWKSNQPESVTGGFTFAGGLGASTAIPGSGWLIGHFFSDNNNELYYTSQVHAYESGTNNGQMAVGLYRYDTASKIWTAIGANAPHSEPYMSHVRPVFYWEDSGLPRSGGLGGWFQNYQAGFKFDSANRMYFAVTGNTNSTLNGANRILYAASKDGGQTWQRANGTAITGFPIRGIDNLPASADVVADTQVDPFFGPSVGLIVDSNGKVGVGVDANWRTWNGSAWDMNNQQNFLGAAGYGYRLPSNELLFSVPGWSKTWRTGTFDTPAIGFDYSNYNNFTNLDEASLRRTGVIYGLGLNTTNHTTAVLKTTITPAVLLSGWSGQDIAPKLPSLRGNSGYLNSTFVSTNYGSVIGNNTDDFYYVYKSLNGDGTIVSRVTSSLASAEGYSRAGVMMRETLDPGAKNVSMLIAPGTNNKGSVFGYRDTTGGGTNGTSNGHLPTTYWVKLVRAGNVFTGYVSADGSTWQLVQSATVAMNQSIYVGLAASSYANGALMQTASFDNVLVSSPCVTAAPTIQITPCSQSTSGATAVNYNVTITNNNPAICNDNLFGFSANASNYYLKTHMEPYNIIVPPGTTGQSLLTITPATGLVTGTYTITVNGRSLTATNPPQGTATTSLVYQVEDPFQLKVSSDKTVYSVNSGFTQTYANLNAITTLNGAALPNVPLVATLTWPDGHSQSITTNSGTGTKWFGQDIQSTSPIGTYKFSVSATYNGEVVTNALTFDFK